MVETLPPLILIVSHVLFNILNSRDPRATKLGVQSL